MALNVTQLIEEFGARYKAGIVKREDLIMPLYVQSDFDQAFTTIEYGDSEKDSVMVDLTNARFQQFSKAFKPIGGMSFTPDKIQMNNIMLDTTVTPDELRRTALEFLIDKSNLDRTQSGLLAVYLEAYLMSAVDNLKHERFKGKFVAPVVTDGVEQPSVQGNLFDGVGYIIRKKTANTSTTAKKPHVINNMATLPTTPAQHVDYVHTFYDMLPDEIKQNIDKICVSATFLEQYIIGKDEKNLYYKNLEVNNKIHLRNGEVVGSVDQNNTGLIWCTVKKNAVKLLANMDNVGKWDVDKKDLKQVIATSDYDLGYGFLNPDWVYHNGNYTGIPTL